MFRVLLPVARFSKKAHAGQFRSGGNIPYFEHPKAVVRILWSYGVRDPDILSAAYTHDIGEDAESFLEELRKLTNFRVMDMLFWLTNMQKGDFWIRHEGLLDHAHKMNTCAKWVKLADRLHNLRSMTEWSPNRQKRYAVAALELLGALFPWPNHDLAMEVRQTAISYFAENRQKISESGKIY
jgi:(p)ppGpp synthase/HD superfamily hydrolase